VGLRDLFKRKPADEGEELRFEVTSRTDDPSEATRQAVETVREAGADLSQPRATDFYLYLRKREDADAAADALRAEGYEINARPSADPESDRPWLLVASRELAVGEASLEEAEALLKRLAERYDGEYDGWETAVG
jgi:regulator of RNase E activity RraB